MCLSDLLQGRALVHPDRTAVHDGGRRLTFAQLTAGSAELGASVWRLGVRPDDPVGVFLEPSLDLATAVWGVVYSGGAYLPLSPEYPDERIRHMVTDARARVVLTDRQLAPRLGGLVPDGTVIVALEDLQAARPPAPSGFRAPVGPRNLAYVIYTSGSTGTPKGIMIEHRSIVSQLGWLARVHGLDGRRTVLQKTPLSFDAAQWEILAPACGATVAMAGPGVYRDPDRLLDLIAEHGVTTLQGVPTLLQALVDTDRLGACSSLRQVFSGGEALTRRLAVELLDALPGAELVNLYGPSECTINSSSHVVDRDAVGAGPDVVSIGRPVDGTAYHILDRAGSPVGPGEIGELHVSGVQLARGYLHRPDLTEERFRPNPFSSDPAHSRLYRTGDLARWDAGGSVAFAGRTDSQVKLRGFRVELDEIRCAIEAHDWVKRAAVVVRDDSRTGANLVAFAELNQREAALMDQGSHGSHHRSKSSRLQIRAQLSDPGCRDTEDVAARPRIDLAGRTPTAAQREAVFARKTYRFFEGGEVTRDDLLLLLDAPRPDVAPRLPESLTGAELGGLLRWFGQFRSEQRLLPKYGYASPGSLYATQLYLELSGAVGDIAPGLYYYHPVHHQLVLIRPGHGAAGGGLRLHFVGRTSAVEQVYRTNTREVLQIETGHMLGLFDAVLQSHGLLVGEPEPAPGLLAAVGAGPADHHLGSYAVGPFTGPRIDPVEVYVQAHPGRVAGLQRGLYRYLAGRLEQVGDELVEKRHVVAINQEVYRRAGFGVSLLSRHPEPWQRYVELGRTLHHLQMNDLGLGLMSSGYSSETGNDLPSARRIAETLGLSGGVASYFALGGRVSDTQRRSEGMKEDVVHMRGPAEMVRDDLAERLPRYMVPNRVAVLDALPLTPNGKVDLRALRELDEAAAGTGDAPMVAPRTPTEEALVPLWRRALELSELSVHDDFFRCGGNSLVAVGLIGRINRELGGRLPVQALFEDPTVEALARRLDRNSSGGSSRLVRLGTAEVGRRPVFCWPGLGGYPMNLRLLAGRMPGGRPLLGVQAHGINPGEAPYPTLAEMAARDVELIRREQPEGPYTLWGYSFGSRVAFEAAHQLEQAGHEVDELLLIAPGHPRLRADLLEPAAGGRRAAGPTDFDDPSFVAILFSVFAGRIDHPLLDACLRATRGEDSFLDFVHSRLGLLDGEVARRVIRVVRRTFGLGFTEDELARRRIAAPVAVLAARGDEPSFVETAAGRAACSPEVLRLCADHYGLLRDSGVDELLDAVHHGRAHRKDAPMPHVSVRHSPRRLGADRSPSPVRHVHQPEIVRGRARLITEPQH
ncbi:amino acid adenylation domain-containing protein [Geodermatophilus sp. CPCC 205761]|uniref:non-ribosomal peptide synthetase family protein n=1 Tax=Geodermatophilus sp. CPCC 205761 TaxID=2936597 RepID=UPI003EE8BB69